MAKVCIILDDWKLPIFKQMLDDNSYKYEQCDGPLPRSTLLKVTTWSVSRLKELTEKMNAEAARHKAGAKPSG